MSIAELTGLPFADHVLIAGVTWVAATHAVNKQLRTLFAPVIKRIERIESTPEVARHLATLQPAPAVSGKE